MLTFAASGALALHMPLAPGPPRMRPIHMQAKANSWQGRLDKALLDVDVAPQARFRLLQRALKDPQLKDDVASAVSAIQERGFEKATRTRSRRCGPPARLRARTSKRWPRSAPRCRRL